MEYTVEHFISKFEATEDEMWGVESFIKEDKLCALGHCGERNWRATDESKALTDLFKKHGLVVEDVNDGYYSTYPQLTPKQRILAALYDIKNGSK